MASASPISIYKISFTSGGLYLRDSIKVAELYFQVQDWSALKEQVIEKNLLQARTKSSLVRTARELLQRLQSLTEAQLRLLVDGTRQEQNQLLWLAVCKHYEFVRDFATEVIREKYLRLDWEVTYPDFDMFFFDKSEWHAELAGITESTHKKLRQVLFRMLVEAEILSPENKVIPAVLSPQVARVISEDDPTYFSAFPISETDIRGLMP